MSIGGNPLVPRPAPPSRTPRPTGTTREAVPMIFSPELARQVRAGNKTMTRRPVKGQQPCRYRPGKDYAVQPGRGKPATCRIRVDDIRQERVGDIPFTDVRQEGFQTTDDFKAYWVALHCKAWLANESRRLDQAENDDGVVLDRDLWIWRRSNDWFDQECADRLVWVIRFHLFQPDEVRLLALRSDELYVSSPSRALPSEPEAVDEFSQRRITADAGMTSRQWHALETARRDRDRELLSREDQLARLQRSARLRKVDISRESWALQNMLNSASDENFTRKVRKAEQRVFRMAA